MAPPPEFSRAGRLDESVSSPSLATTMSLASPSVRRSARIRDSPVINYKDSSVRNSSRRDSKATRRIFGLDNTDLNLSKQTINESHNISEEEEITDPTPSQNGGKRINFLPKNMSKTSQVLLASFILVVVLLLAEQSLHLFYFSLCWTSNLLSSLRTVAFTLPEVFSTPHPGISSDSLEQFVSRVEAEMDRMNTELNLIREKERSFEDIETIRRGESSEDDSSRRELENMKRMFEEYQNIESLRSEDVSKLKGSLESFARKLHSLESSNVTATAAFTVEKSLEDVKMELLEWRRKTEAESSLVQEQLKIVSEKYAADVPHLKQSIKDLSVLTTKLKLDLERQESQTHRGHGESHGNGTERLDWASSQLGCSISAGADTKPYLETPRTEITVFGVSVWRQFTPVSSITHRPHSGHCWAFSGKRGSVSLNISRPISLHSIVMEHPNSPASPRWITVTDLSRNVEVVTVEYQLGGRGGKVFPLNEPVNVDTLSLAFLDNWGEEQFTCVGKIGLLENE